MDECREDAQVILLVNGSLVEGTEDVVECSESTLRPDDEPSNMSTGRQLQNVQPLHADNLHTRQIPERLHNPLILVIHHQRAPPLPMPAVTHLTLTSPELPRVGDLDDVRVGLERLEERDGFLGLDEGFGGGGDDEGDFFNFFDAVTASEDKRGKGSGRKGGDGGEAALVLVHLDVPLAPDLGGREHATATAHVTEGSLIIAIFDTFV